MSSLVVIGLVLMAYEAFGDDPEDSEDSAGSRAVVTS